MKLMFASDIHGSAAYCEKALQKFNEEKADRLILLGDILYHGPRNPLPEQYDPQAVARMLNGIKERILCVRGNCDSEVDQMMLDFPIMADCALLFLDGKTVFVTHGHVYNEQKPPKLGAGNIVIHGHTHVSGIWQNGGLMYINPGSVALPKENTPHSYMIYEDGAFKIRDFEGKTLCRVKSGERMN
ncbi:MAG: phosphodiesterase [Clostridia bacterium]|nr:phosphodiesterase [Clostridia bacterium]